MSSTIYTYTFDVDSVGKILKEFFACIKGRGGGSGNFMGRGGNFGGGGGNFGRGGNFGGRGRLVTF